MRNVSDLLRESDPLDYEPLPTTGQWLPVRQRILDTPPAPPRPPRRRVLVAAVVGFALAGVIAGYWSRAAVEVAAAVRFEVRLAEPFPGPGLRDVALPGGGHIYLHQEAVVGNGDIARAELLQSTGAPGFNISVTFTADGAAKMRTATQAHLGRPVAILLDGDVVIAPVVKSPIAGSAMITGNYTRAEAERIVAGIVER